MATQTTIQWTQATLNAVTGCSEASPGCSNCYAKPMSRRLEAMGQEKYRGTTTKVNGKLAWSGKVKLDEAALKLPLRWKDSKLIFVNSMSDLFHPEVPTPFILRVFRAMQDAPWHCYQILTKRSERLLRLNELLPWMPSVWMGVTVENADYQFRINHLRQTSAVTKFLSLEPLLGPMPKLDLSGINWVIAGGESGPGARPMDPSWVRDIRDQSVAAGVPFFFKQWGGRNKKVAGRMLDGRTWDEMPVVLYTSSGTRAVHAESGNATDC